MSYGPGDTVKCVDASGTGGSLIQGWNYLVSHFVTTSCGTYVHVVGVHDKGWYPERFEKRTDLQEHNVERERVSA